MKNLIYLLGIFLVSALYPVDSMNAQNPSRYVNPFIGTSGGGNTHPGAMVPWGMVSVCPFNVYGEPNKHDILKHPFGATYKHNNTFLTGFTHVNLSGTGCPDLGTVMLMPIHGKLETDPLKYGSTYREENASAGYYTTFLDKYGIKTEMTATERAGISRYQFPAGESHVILNQGLSLTSKEGGYLQIHSNREVVGMRSTGGFCGRHYINQPVYFVIQFSKAADDFGAWDDERHYPGHRRELAGEDFGAFFSFRNDQEHSVTVKVGVSYVSVENARLNLEQEMGDATFETVRESAQAKWDKQLSRIKVEGGTEDDKVLFYTGLYHILIHPNIFSDVNGEYIAFDGHRTKAAHNYTRYTIFSLWDTYRNVHPFLSLIYPEVQRDMAVTMVEMYKEAGRLPKWELGGRETFVMVGDPACIVLNDTYQRGIRNFDIQMAYQAMIESATNTSDNPVRPLNEPYDKYGYIPVESRHKGAVSIHQEYALADWNVAQMARAMDDEANYDKMMERALSYKHIFDKGTGFLRLKHEDGSWKEPFDPLAMKYEDRSIPHGYVEGNAWQYLYFVPHDTEGLIKLLGKKTFTSKLAEALSEEGKKEGKFGLWNEPDIAYPFLFNYVKGEEWRTSGQVHSCIDRYYDNKPDGLPGNDDCGTMSAWLAFAMMGFYPDCPGDPEFTLFEPSFDKITITLNPDYADGERLVITKAGGGQQFVFNGKKLKRPFISHLELVKGGTLEISE